MPPFAEARTGIESHLFMGMCSLTLGVQVITAIHLLIVLFILGAVDSMQAIVILGLEISPTAQVFNATWATIGIPPAIFGGIGAIYRYVDHIAFYKKYLIAAAVVQVMWLMYMVTSGSLTKCEGDSPQPLNDTVSQRMNFACGLSNMFIIAIMLFGVGVTSYAAFVLAAAEKDAKLRYEGMLQKYAEPWEQAAALARHEMDKRERTVSHMNPLWHVWGAYPTAQPMVRMVPTQPMIPPQPMMVAPPQPMTVVPHPQPMTVVPPQTAHAPPQTMTVIPTQPMMQHSTSTVMASPPPTDLLHYRAVLPGSYASAPAPRPPASLDSPRTSYIPAQPPRMVQSLGTPSAVRSLSPLQTAFVPTTVAGPVATTVGPAQPNPFATLAHPVTTAVGPAPPSPFGSLSHPAAMPRSQQPATAAFGAAPRSQTQYGSAPQSQMAMVSTGEMVSSQGSMTSQAAQERPPVAARVLGVSAAPQFGYPNDPAVAGRQRAMGSPRPPVRAQSPSMASRSMALEQSAF